MTDNDFFKYEYNSKETQFYYHLYMFYSQITEQLLHLIGPKNTNLKIVHFYRVVMFHCTIC